MLQPPIYFYDTTGTYLRILQHQSDSALDPQLFDRGIAAWELRTAVSLRRSGVEISVVDSLPNSGILMLHAEQLDRLTHIPDSLFLVVFLADKGWNPRGDYFVVQSPAQETAARPIYTRMPIKLKSRYMPHWPQSGVTPRCVSRGSIFKHINYYGRENNLHKGLLEPAFKSNLAEYGLEFRIVPAGSWHDYSDADCVVALRPSPMLGINKPASKLFNAWLAGVPAILGNEPSYQLEGESGKDFLLVANPSEVVEALLLLKDRPDIRDEIVKQGYAKAATLADQLLDRRWLEFLEAYLLPYYDKWKRKSALSRKLARLSCRLTRKLGSS